MFKKVTVMLAMAAMLFSAHVVNAETEASIKAGNKVKDLSKAYEVWKEDGIKFVVRDKSGKFVSWNVGRLESWGAKSKWVVRDPKGKFLHNAKGNVETWKNGKTRLVLRDQKGRLMTHIDIGLTDKGTFYSTVVGLRRLKNPKFLHFVQDRVADICKIELKKNQLSKVKAMMKYLEKHYNDDGVKNFKPVLKEIRPVVTFMANESPNNKRIVDLSKDVAEMYNKL